LLNYATPLGAIDNAIEIYQNSDATTGEKVFATIEAAASMVIIKGEGEGNTSIGKTKASLEPYEVGTFKELKNQSVPGDGLDIHHAPQQNPAKQVISNYDKNSAPSISLPSNEHSMIPTTKGNYSGTARNQLAKDIKDLRNNTNAPNSSLQKLIELNKNTYPELKK